MCHISVLNVSGRWHVINVIDIGEESGGSKILTLLTVQQTSTTDVTTKYNSIKCDTLLIMIHMYRQESHQNLNLKILHV